jgi:NAD(P)-dependent dehydrogenase (short-subunit alcohol dehydrogenase family)
MGLLDGHRAIATGGASGIGLATARRMREEGAQVALVDCDAEKLAAAAREIGAASFAADVADAAALDAAFGAAAERMGGLSILFNNAGVGQVSPLHRYPPEAVERLLDVNLIGVYNGLRAAIPRMLAGGGGAIVNNASGSGVQPTRGEAPYSAAKAGVIALTRSAALEYGPRIRVNCVSPGMIRTPMSEALFRTPGLLDPLLEAIPAGRIGTPEDVAELVVFLCSDRASFVTGQNLLADGGLSLVGGGIDPVLRRLLAMMERRGI